MKAARHYVTCCSTSLWTAIGLVVLCTAGAAWAAPPTTLADAYAVDEDTTLTVAAPGLLQNDSDADGDAFTVASTDAQSALRVPLSVASDGSFTYTPPAEFSGSDSFDYIATDSAPTGLGEFSPHPTRPAFASGYARAAHFGDLDGDGDVDLLLAYTETGAVFSVFLNDGSGHFTQHTPATFGAGAWGSDLADIDGDGDLDLVASDAGCIWLNDGSAVFTATTAPIPSIGLANHLILGDLDGDDDPDLVYQHSNTYKRTTFLNDGNGLFTPHTTPTAGTLDSSAFTLGDIDGDDDLDLVTVRAASLGNTTGVYVNDGTGAFSTHPTFGGLPVGNRFAVVLADIDGDGDNDALFGGRDATTPGVLIYVNDGVGAFSPHTAMPSLVHPYFRSLDAGDIDGDGDIDIMVGSDATNDKKVVVWVNDGNGLFTSHALVPSYLSAAVSTITLHDLDGDLDLDAFGTNGSGGNQEVWVNQTEYVPLSLPTTVTITINPVNDAPVAAVDQYTTQEDGTLTVVAPGVLGNDFDVERDLLSVESPPTTSALGGAVTLLSDGSLVYVPPSDFFGVDTFSYQATDGAASSSPVEVIISVVSTPDPPVTVADAVTVDEDSSVAIDVLANDSDPDGDELTVVSVTTPSHGVATIVAGTTVLYVPDPNYDVSDVFDYVAADPAGAETTGSVFVTINGINDAPSFATPTPEGTVIGAEGTELSFSLYADDLEGDTVTYSALDLPPGATVDASTGQFTWTPTWDQAGTWNLTGIASDGWLDDRRAFVLEISFIDVDADGLPDTWEQTTGLAPDNADSDGDGISDFVEVDGDLNLPADTDSDGTIDALDFDSDADGLPDRVEAGNDPTSPLDSDADGVADFRDTDSDNDEVLDALDNCTTEENPQQQDIDGDTIGDACDSDADGDLLTDDFEGPLGLSPRVADTDGDSILDGDEATRADAPDTDGDGDIDALDTDSDGDGVADAAEAGDDALGTPPVDTDEDGTPDFRDSDSDDDGEPDSGDNCRLVVNPDQLDGDDDGIGDACEGDADGDGILDDQDNCVQIANVDQHNIDDDSLGDVCDDDKDGDGVLDGTDLCPFVADAALQVDSDADGLGDTCDTDLDGDGVDNLADNCPLLANSDQADLDEDGLGDACDAADDTETANADGGCGCSVRSGERRSSMPWMFIVAMLGVGLVARRRE